MKDSFEKIDEIVAGFKLQTGTRARTVLYIYSRAKDYIIFEIEETGQITYKTTPEFEDNTFKIALKLDKVESYLGEDIKSWAEYKNTMADIYSLYLSNDPEKTNTAEQLLNSVLSEIEYNQYSKLYYLLPCLLSVLSVGLFTAFLRSYNLSIPRSWLTFDQNFIDNMYMLTYGGVGGLLSIAINIEKHEDKISRIKWQRVFAGVFRMLIAMLSGLIIAVLFKSSFIHILNGTPNASTQHALAILAGFSQNLIPNLVSKGEKLINSNTAEQRR